MPPVVTEPVLSVAEGRRRSKGTAARAASRREVRAIRRRTP